MAAQASPFFSFLGFHPAALAGAVNERLAAAQGLHLLEAASWAAGKASLGSAAADAAQKLFYTTVPKLTTRAERVAAARAAIAAGPCADAHTLLAGEEAKDVSEAAGFTEEAVRIAQTQLNGALPAWELLPTRPYLRALHAHASVLLALGQPEKAIALLAHVPAVVTDVLNLQLLLVVAHLRREQWEAARRLIDARAVRPMSAAWLWLAAYQAEQAARASVDSANALARALKANQHMAPLVLKRRQPAPVPALSAAEGSEAEAELVVSGLRAELLDSSFDGWVRAALAAGLGLHPCPNCAQTVSTALARMMRIDAHLKNKRFEEAEKEISVGGANLPPMHPLKLHYLARYSELLLAHSESEKAKQIAHGGLHMDVIQFTKMASRQMHDKDKAEVVAAAELCTDLNVPYRERLLAVWKRTAGSDFDPADHTECQKKMTEQLSAMTAMAGGGGGGGGGGAHGHNHGASGSHGHSHGPPAQCGTCGAAGKSLSLCGGCQRVAYCSRECQKKSWPEHKLICKQLAAGACAPGEHAAPAHGHSHNGQPCHGHGPQSHGHGGGDSHGHSHNGQPCHGHGEQAQHGHGHGGAAEQHGHSHGGQPCHGHGPQAPPPAQHGHSHNGQPCHGHGPQAPQQAQHGHSHDHDDHGHSHGDKSGGHSLHSLD